MVQLEQRFLCFIDFSAFIHSLPVKVCSPRASCLDHADRADRRTAPLREEGCEVQPHRREAQPPT